MHDEIKLWEHMSQEVPVSRANEEDDWVIGQNHACGNSWCYIQTEVFVDWTILYTA